VTSRLFRALLIACGSLCVALGVIGIFLPVMPTTVFLLLAAACYARSSERFYARLVNNPVLGHYIRSKGRGMRRRDKAITLAMLWAGIGVTMIWSVEAIWLRALLAGIAVAVTVHVARLPAFRAAAAAEDVPA
jgi:uncharacterized membrane protein YbaN (DUF454 family)